MSERNSAKTMIEIRNLRLRFLPPGSPCGFPGWSVVVFVTVRQVISIEESGEKSAGSPKAGMSRGLAEDGDLARGGHYRNSDHSCLLAMAPLLSFSPRGVRGSEQNNEVFWSLSTSYWRRSSYGVDGSSPRYVVAAAVTVYRGERAGAVSASARKESCRTIITKRWREPASGFRSPEA